MAILSSFFRFIKFLPAIIWSVICDFIKFFIPKACYAKDVSQDIVLITGAASGLGRALALEYAKLGSKLILWDIDKVGLNETKGLVQIEYDKITIHKEVLDCFCLTYLVDVSDKKKIKDAAKLVYDDLNKNKAANEPDRFVTVLINNAGILNGLMLHELSDEQIEKTFSINILAHFWTVRAFLPKMIEHKRGHIVEIASLAGHIGMHKQVDYCATKFSVVGFEESLSVEINVMGLSDNIHTTVICPQYFSSNLFTGFDTGFCQMLTTEHVAKEAVMAMRCNQSTLVLPRISGFFSLTFKFFSPRKAAILTRRALGYMKALENLEGNKNSQLSAVVTPNEIK